MHREASTRQLRGATKLEVYTWNQGSIGSDEFEAGEEIANFEGGGFRGVGTVGAIVADAGAKVAANGAGCRFFGIGGAHGVAPLEDGAIGFENHGEDFAGAHEVGEFAKEGARFVDGVETAGFFFSETHRLDGDDFEASFVNSGKDFALLVVAYGVGFDDGEGAFERQEKIPPVGFRRSELTCLERV